MNTTPDAARAQRAQAQLQAAVALHQQGRLTEAARAYDEVLRLVPDHADALHMLGVVAAQGGRFEQALALLLRARQAAPDDPGVLSNLGGIYRELRRFDDAIECFGEAVRLAPGFAQAHANRGNLLSDAGRHAEALAAFDQVVALAPRDPVGHHGRGLVLHALGRLDDALAALDRAVALAPREPRFVYARGNVQRDRHQLVPALADYDVALALNPDDVEVLTNRGLTLLELNRFDDCLAAYRRALELKPDDFGALNNLGIALSQLERHREAVEVFARAAAVRESFAVLHNQAYSLRQLDRHAEALASLERAHALAPEHPFIRGDLVMARMRVCRWDHFDDDAQALVEGALAGRRVAQPFALLAAADAPEAHRRAAEVWVADQHPPRPDLGAPVVRADGGRLRVAYLSADFRDHPVAYLMAEVFERHDRARFELFAFNGARDDGGTMRRRLEAAFDHFIDVRGIADRDLAVMARERGIDIVVDLTGFTAGSRLGALAWRLAPVQVSYIGYLGTLGAPYIDYLLADATLVPPEARAWYTETVACLPSYQANDTRRAISGRTFTREELGLPPAGFVFCCFNGTYKLTPEVFGRWMRILLAVPGSVLMLFADNEWVFGNLRREAQARGVDPARLVFAGQLPRAEYLARYRAADLFLDTTPYNAGTTASDALWAGLPVLTVPGRSFASRMAASLLHAAGLPELVARDGEDYVRMAIELATQPGRLAALRSRLADQREHCLLFDSTRFTRHLEAAFEAMMARARAGLPPDPVDIAPSA